MNLDQPRRYARQIMLTDVGEAGQQTLLNAKVLVIGAGGLGSALISYLTAAGVGTIGIIDDDRVELSNLARQIIHETGDIGRLKVESASDRVAELNPEVRVVTYPFAITAENAAQIIRGTSSATANSPLEGESTRSFSASVGGNASRKIPPTKSPESDLAPPQGGSSPAVPLGASPAYDVVADGCDNFASRFAVNAACVALKIPLVSAAIAGWSGQVMTIAPHLAPASGCYQCLVSPDAPEANTCTDTGIIGPLAGIIGSMQALEVVNAILGRPALVGKLAIYDAKRMTQRVVDVPRDADCRVCR